MKPFLELFSSVVVGLWVAGIGTVTNAVLLNALVLGKVAFKNRIGFRDTAVRIAVARLCAASVSQIGCEGYLVIWVVSVIITIPVWQDVNAS